MPANTGEAGAMHRDARLAGMPASKGSQALLGSVQIA
ncbi:hypothetical protein YSA_06672 [Pseudomonas putida ND6]|uniref:Uncharacterized protein n=1 Tax=Pseudomonas putida ND6 TaxID=231023 RepID=I3UXZ6_PSEPU|nr:hypothetical protein YSA_06672 [Pseudomonas putida ND6]